jgi:peroxiredoxin
MCLSNKNLIKLLIIFVLAGLSIPTRHVQAAILDCTASVSKASIVKNTSDNFVFHITNSDPDNASVWVRITRPSGNFSFGEMETAWNVNPGENDLSLTGGMIETGGSVDFTIPITALDNISSSVNWVIELSDQTDGSNAKSCAGSLGTSITGPVGPTVSDITISSLTTSSVKINWNTEREANSSVQYGTNASYGSSAGSESEFVTTHNVDLTGLSPSTTYHFKLISTDHDGGATETGDSVFATSEAGTVTTVTVTQTSTVTQTVTRIVTPIPTATPTPDLTPPRISVNKPFEKSYKVAPTVEGKAFDISGVDKVYYSLDAGKNWAPVDTLFNAGKPSVSYSFTPGELTDDSYDIRIQAWDMKGNAGIFKAGKMIIDRLPPIIGPLFFSAGPIELKPDEHGIITVSENMKTKVTLSAAGGPIQMTVQFVDDQYQILPINPTTLFKDPSSGLWSGDIIFPQSGIYTFRIRAVDGADNITEKYSQVIQVVVSGRVYSNKPLETQLDSTVMSVYFDEPISGRRVIWDGKPYGQANPLKINPDGFYSLFLPSGKYYLTVNSPNYKTFTSTLFELPQPTVLSTDIQLTPKDKIQIGNINMYIPDLFPIQYNIQPIILEKPILLSNNQVAIIGHQIPSFELKSNSNKVFTDLDLRGKNAILTVLSSWYPQTVTQLASLEKFSQKFPDTRVVVIMNQESVTATEIFRKRSKASVSIIADPDGILLDPFSIQTLPTHYFLDPKGIISSIKSSLLTESEIENQIIK